MSERTSLDAFASPFVKAGAVHPVHDSLEPDYEFSLHEAAREKLQKALSINEARLNPSSGETVITKDATSTKAKIATIGLLFTEGSAKLSQVTHDVPGPLMEVADGFFVVASYNAGIEKTFVENASVLDQ